MSTPAPIADAADAIDGARPRLFWMLHAGGWLGYFVYSFLAALGHGKPFDYWIVIAISSSAGFAVTLVLRYVLRYLSRFPVPVFLVSALLPILLCSLLMSQAYLFGLLQWGCAECRPQGPLGYIAYMGSFTYVVISWAGLYFGIKTYLKLQWQTRETLQAHAMAHQAQLKMLRYQLNPHFLFNTLNAISTLILDRENGTANRMVQSLSAFLRHSLDNDPMQRVTLRQELDALTLYLDIEKIRFAERLRIETDIGEDCWRALLPSLLLQPLVENAIKYAVAKQIAGGLLRIEAQRDGAQLVLRVIDDGPGCQTLQGGELPPGKGVGLRNTRERLNVLYGEDSSFAVRNRERGIEVELRLPFETKQIGGE